MTGVELAAGARALDDEARGALRQPKRLDRQCRIEIVAIAGDERDLAHDAVLRARKAEDAETGGRLVENRQIAYRTGEGRQISRRIVAGEGEAALSRRRRRGDTLGEHEASDNRRLGEARGEYLVVVDFGARSGIGDLKPLAFELCDGKRRRRAVWFGQDHVEPDRRGALGRQPVDDGGQHGARPRPLAKLADAFIVDVDDRDRAFSRRAGPELLIGVEDEIVQPGERAEGRIGGADDQRDD